jgi:hypothetical protein
MSTFTDGYGGDVTTYLDTNTDIGNDSDQSASTRIYMHRDNSNGVQQAGLIYFTLTSLVDKVIDAANLYLYEGQDGTTDPFTGNVCAVLAANTGWYTDKTKATWSYKIASTTRWAGDAASNGGADAGCSISGTDWNATPMGTWAGDRVNAAGYEYIIALNTTQFTALVAANYGLVLLPTSTASTNARSVFSSDVGVTGWRPKLVVTYHAAAAGLASKKALLGVGI